jgi:hypothetical protein
MLRLLDRHIASIEDRMILVAPPDSTPPDVFNNVTRDSSRRGQMIRRMQRLRGSVYLSEGNVKPYQLTVDGLHQTPEDDKSWHLLMTEGDDVSSCAWYMVHDNSASIANLRVRNCPLAKHETWRATLSGAVESEIGRARRAGLRYAELGGWAIRKERRCTPDGLMIALATYGLARILGGALGITTANVAHSCAAILRRMGGSPLEFEGTTIPPYFDARYNTDIELLKFDSRRPRTRYAGLIDVVREKLSSVQVVARTAASSREMDAVERDLLHPFPELRGLGITA